MPDKLGGFLNLKANRLWKVDMRNFSHITAFAKIAVLACLLNCCGQGPPETAPAKGEVVKGRVMTVELSRLPVTAVLPGTVVSANKVDVSSRLTGYVHGLQVHEGELVKEGQLLLAVDPSDVKAQIRQAEAELAKAEAALKDARSNYERYKGLYRDQSTTWQRFEEIKTNYKVAVGSYNSAQAALATARAQLKYAEVHAPFNGLVVSKLVDNGQLATPGTPLLVLENPKHLQVQVQVPEQTFPHLKLGQEVHLEFEGPDYKTHIVTGSVERLVAAANPLTHTHLVKIGLPAESRSYSGEYGLVKIPVGEQEAIVVPSEAIFNRAGISGVFVLNALSEAQFRMVTPGERVSQGRVVLSGLSPGDRVIVSAQAPLANGVRIQAQTGDGV
ncbi:MAG: efflux RND transporter periplasmic adaptor subunit [Desulfobacterales bacterium]